MLYNYKPSVWLTVWHNYTYSAGVFQPEIITGNTIASWAEFWSRAFPRAKLPNAQSSSSETPSSASILIVFAPKQLLLLAQSTSTRQSWDHITRLVIELFKKHLIRYRDIEEQAVAVVRQEWPHVICSLLSLKDFRDYLPMLRKFFDIGSLGDPLNRERLYESYENYRDIRASLFC